MNICIIVKTVNPTSLVADPLVARPVFRSEALGLHEPISSETAAFFGSHNPDIVVVPGFSLSEPARLGRINRLQQFFRRVRNLRTTLKTLAPSRLTSEYLEQRAFYQGVCDSYTRIKRDRRVSPAPDRTWKDPFRPTKWHLERMMLLRNPTVKKSRRLMARAHYDGIQFHRKEVRRDPTLLEWVLRDDYFDYRLPAGWKAFLGHPAPA